MTMKSKIAVCISLWLLSAGFDLPASAENPAKSHASAIQVMKIESDEVKLPPEFEMALYENLIQEIQQSGRWQRVYRDGERSAAGVPDLVVLRTTVRGFKPGSERARQVTTVAGATSIRAHAQVSGPKGELLLDRDVSGKVRFFGENLRATRNLAHSLAKLIRERL